MILIRLFLNFAKIGLFTFGGGYAMLPLIERACVENNKWITKEEMVNITVLAESTPGPIAINCATFVGYKQKGIAGAIVATLGIIMPSFLIIFAISVFLEQFIENKWVAGAFQGIKIAVGILIIDAAIKLFSKLKKRTLTYVITAASFAAMLCIDIFAVRISSVVLLLITALIGYIVYRVKQSKGGAE
ncbi:MAG: chromate transporter [Eubacterium sp.]|nr:chromate transporter [Eubacterium sp.]